MMHASANDRTTRTEILILVIITIVAAALRIYKLAEWPLYGDEGTTISHIEHLDNHIRISPLSYLPVMAVVKLFGTEPWVWRLWPCLVGIVTIPLLYHAVRKIGGRTMALWSAGLLAITPWHIAQSQMARHYPLQMLLGFYVVYATYRAVEEDAVVYYVLSAVFGLLAVLTRPSSLYLMFVVFAFAALLLVWPGLRPPTLRWRRLGMLAAAHALLVVLGFLGTTVYGEGTEPWGHSSVHVLLTMGYYLTVSAVLVATGASLLGLWQRNRLAILLGLYAFVPIVMVAATALVRSAIGVAAFFVVPGVLLLGAWVIAEIGDRYGRPERWFSAVLGLALVGAFVEHDYQYYTFAHGYRSPIKMATQYVRERLRPGDEVYVFSRGSGEEVQALIGKGTTLGMWPAVPEGSPQLSAAARTWVVSEDVLSTWDVPDPARRWLDEHARLMNVIPAYIGPRSRSVWIYLYSPSDLPLEAGEHEHP